MATLVLADVAFGPIFFVILGGSFVPFLLALVIETVVLWACRWGSLRDCLADVAVVNLVSAAIGFLFFRQEELMESGWFWIAAWLLSTLLEGWVLYWRRQTAVTRVVATSLSMNTASYILLVWLMWPIIRHW